MVYIELMSATSFGKAVGMESRNKAMRHLARILERYGERLESEAFRAAHIGAGHFVCLMEPQHADIYCKGVQKSWENHLPSFYASVGLEGAVDFANKAAALNGPPLLSLMMCVTDSGIAGARSAQEYFDVLAQLRKKALASGSGGVYFDHRKGA